jgi:Tfp pilus tip-associated adhesin PilY1
VKIKREGVLTAFHYCITMAGRAFAATPWVVSVALDDYSCKVGESVYVKGTLKPNFDHGVIMMNLKITNDKDLVVYDQKVCSTDSQTVPFKVNTAKLNLTPGKYIITMRYLGDGYILGSCKSTTTLTVTS